MGKAGDKPKKIACFTEEQQTYYETLSPNQRRYVDFRGQGYSKSQSYRMSGYKGTNIAQSAYALEKNNRGIPELINALLKVKTARDVVENNEDSQINKTIDALAMQDGAEKAIEKIEGADGETARRIKFYRDIANGKIKTVRKTTQLNPQGGVVKTTIEEINDIDTRIKARKELDRILGLNSIIDIDKFKVGDITINIVDASKKEELEDERNKIVLDSEEVEVLEDKKVVVTESNVEVKGKGKTKTVEAVGA